MNEGQLKDGELIKATPAQEVHPLASRCYAMSEPHLSGYRLVLGFETLEAVGAAHTWVANVRKAPQQGIASNNPTLEVVHPAECTPSWEPTFAQLKQVLDGLDRCHMRDSKAEFLRTWIRDWTQHKHDAAQAKIDALMLEYCPEEMTEDQLQEWERHQRVVKVGEIE